MRIEATITGLTAEQLFRLYSDLEIRPKMEHPPKVLKLVEQPTKYSDVVYSEIHLPFPMTNREFLHKRFYLGNKEYPEVVKELGLYDWDHKYYVIIAESIERPDYPITSKLVRAESKFSYTLIEEDPNDSEVVRMKSISCTKMNGNIPSSMLASMGMKMAGKMLDSLKESSKKIFGEGK